MKRYPFIYLAIFLLTVLDMIFTVTGLKLGVITEANPIMNYFIKASMGLTSFCVLAYVAIVLVLFYRISPKIRWMNTVLAGLTSVKLFTLLLHIRWISTYLVGNI